GDKISVTVGVIFATEIVVAPEILEIVATVAVMFALPAVSGVTETVSVPFVSGLGPGSNMFWSELLRTTESLKPVMMALLLFGSSAVTVTVVGVSIVPVGEALTARTGSLTGKVKVP